MKRQTVVLVGAIWPPRVNFADKVSLVPHLSGGGRVQGNRMNVRPSPSRGGMGWGWGANGGFIDEKSHRKTPSPSQPPP